MGFLRSKKGSIISDYFCAADDIGPFARGDVVEIALYAGHLELTRKSVGKKAAAVALPYTRITGVVYRSEVRTVEKDKSPVKRAVVGGILFGSTGAAVGAISGLGKTVWQHRCGGRGHQRPGKEGSEAQTHAAYPQRHFD